MTGYANTEQTLGLLAWQAGQLGEAESFLLGSLATYGRALPEREWQGSKAICDCINNLGLVKLDSAGPKAALQEFEKARDLNQAGGRPSEVARNLSNIGVAYHRLGNSGSAEASHRKALRLRIESLGNEHPDTNLSRGELAATLRQRANRLLADPQDRDEAIKLLEEAVATDREALRYLAAVPLAQSARAHRLNGLGLDLLDLYRATGADDVALASESQQALEEAIAIRAQVESHTAGEAQSMANLGRLFMATGQFTEASEAFRKAIDLLRRRGGESTITEALAYHWLAQLAVQGDPARDDIHRAVGHAERSLDIYQRLTGDESDSTHRAKQALQVLGRQLRDFDGE